MTRIVTKVLITFYDRFGNVVDLVFWFLKSLNEKQSWAIIHLYLSMNDGVSQVILKRCQIFLVSRRPLKDCPTFLVRLVHPGAAARHAACRRARVPAALVWRPFERRPIGRPLVRRPLERRRTITRCRRWRDWISQVCCHSGLKEENNQNSSLLWLI